MGWARPRRAVQRVRLCARTLQASQAPLAEPSLSPEPSLRSLWRARRWRGFGGRLGCFGVEVVSVGDEAVVAPRRCGASCMSSRLTGVRDVAPSPSLVGCFDLGVLWDRSSRTRRGRRWPRSCHRRSRRAPSRSRPPPGAAPAPGSARGRAETTPRIRECSIVPAVLGRCPSGQREAGAHGCQERPLPGAITSKGSTAPDAPDRSRCTSSMQRPTTPASTPCGPRPRPPSRPDAPCRRSNRSITGPQFTSVTSRTPPPTRPG